MTTNPVADHAALRALLNQALLRADALALPIVAIHLAQAIAQFDVDLRAAKPADPHPDRSI